MLKNYFIIALRNLLRHKVYSLINLLGLAIGVALCVLTFLFVRHEWSYDSFHANADRIYRVYREVVVPGETQIKVNQPVPLGPALAETCPEITHAVRLWSMAPFTLRHRDRMLREEGLVIADPDFFEVFSFPQVAGDLRTALRASYGVVISRELSRKHFGEASPIGEVLTIDGSGLNADFTVTGVVEVPAHSSLRFDLLVSSQYRPNWGDADKWNYYSAFTYVLLSEGTQPSSLEERFHLLNERLAQSSGSAAHLKLQPLRAIHLAAGFPVGLTPASDPAYSYILATISLALLLIACFNFTNLSLGLASSRYREVGVRKVLGSTRGQLVQQFCGEAMLLTLGALLLGWVLAETSLPLFNDLIDRKLTIGYDPAWLVLVGLILAAGVLSGSYPALVLSRPQPHEVLKGRQRLGGRNWFGKGLIVVQFTLSTGLIILTLLMGRQMEFLRTRNLGYSGEQVVVVHEGYGLKSEERRQLLEVYRHTAAQHPGIADIAASSFAFDGGFGAGYVSYADEGLPLAFFDIYVDARLVETLGMELVQGRNFIAGSEKDLKESILVNEAMIRALGWEDPVGKVLPQAQGRTVVGVVRDFHLQSLHHQIEPVVMEYKDDDWLSDLFIKLRPGALPAMLELLEQQWHQVIPYHPFEYSFLDTDMQRQYRADEQWGRIVRYAAILAIFVACLGVFGLTALNLARRTKEIGIRKVLGASVPSIVLLLSKEFTCLVLAANLIAWPLAWYAMHRWLESFAYRIELGPGVFVLGGVLALLIAWLTVSFQAIRAARANPVEALRYE